MFRTVCSARLLRRLLSLVIALAFSASVLEAVVPDVHDGDAVAMRVVDDGPAQRLSDGDDAGQQSVPHEPAHSAHVEHCGHAHLAALSTAVDIEATPVLASGAPAQRILTLESVALPPTLRPPIAEG